MAVASTIINYSCVTIAAFSNLRVIGTEGAAGCSAETEINFGLRRYVADIVAAHHSKPVVGVLERKRAAEFVLVMFLQSISNHLSSAEQFRSILKGNGISTLPQRCVKPDLTIRGGVT